MAKIAPPPLRNLLLEGPRTLWAVFAFWQHFVQSHNPMLGEQLGRKSSRKKNKSPIVVVPGFLAPNATTLGLRNYLESEGHRTHTPDIIVNHGGRSILRATEDAINRAADEAGAPAVAVGHSLGGAVCLLAAYRAAAVGRVITLGSPLRTAMGEEGANSALRLIHGGLSLFEDWAGVAHELHEHMRSGKPPVPLTAIRAKGDGVVAWEAAAHPWEGNNHDVGGSHCGLIASEEVAAHIARSLSGRAQSSSRRMQARPVAVKGFDLSAA